MAAVPEYGDPKVNSTGPNDARFSSPDTSAFGANGRQLQQFGEALQGAGETMGKIYEHEQDQANDTAVIDAENKAREAAIHLTIDKDEGYTNIQGGDVMNVNGQPLAVEYRARYQQQLRDIEGSLSNPVQKQAFAKSAATLDEDFYAKAAEHEATEYKGWQQSVVKGSAELASQEIGANYGDTAFVDKRLDTLDVSVAKLGSLQGLSGNEITALQNTARSDALRKAVGTALDSGDATTARSLFNRYQDKLLGPDRAAIEGPLKREEALAVGQSYGTDYVRSLLTGSAVGGVPPINAVKDGKLDPMVAWSFTAQHEGGYAAHDANGAPVNFGVNQSANPGVDVKNLTRDQAGQIFVKKYWGPSGAAKLPPALAAMHADTYFINPAQAQKFLKQSGGDPARYMQMRIQWMEGLVAKEPGKFGKFQKAWASRNRDLVTFASHLQGGGINPATSRPNMTAEDAVVAATTKLMTDHPDASPEMRKEVEQSAEHTWSVHHESVGQADEQTLSGVMTQLIKNGGDVNALDPATRNAIPGDKWDSVLTFARGIQAYGKEKRDPAHDDAMYDFAVSHPEVLRDASESNFLAKYAGHPQFEAIANYRAQLRGEKKAGGKDDSGSLNYTTINRVVDSRLQSIGVDPSDKDQAGHIGAARRILNGAIAGEQRRLGRQLTDAETESFVDRQFARPGVVHTSFLGARTQIPLFAVDVGHIPPTDLKQIDDSLDRAGQPKTDANRLALYYAARSR